MRITENVSYVVEGRSAAIIDIFTWHQWTRRGESSLVFLAGAKGAAMMMMLSAAHLHYVARLS